MIFSVNRLREITQIKSDAMFKFAPPFAIECTTTMTFHWKFDRTDCRREYIIKILNEMKI